MNKTHRRLAMLTALALAASIGVGSPPASADVAFPGCADADHPGGDWRHHGANLAGHRNQPSETVIGPDNVRDIQVRGSVNIGSNTNGTPVIANGCLVVTDQGGSVNVFNADTLQLVWRSEALPGTADPLATTVITGSPAVSDDLWIYVGVNCRSSCNPGFGSASNRPYTAAFAPSPEFGQWVSVWRKEVDNPSHGNVQLVPGPLLYGDFKICTQADIDAETVSGCDMTAADGEDHYEGPILLQGWGGGESSGFNPSNSRGGFTFFHPKTGRVLGKGSVIPDEDYSANPPGRGGSIWGVPAIDPDTNFVYAPTGNPATPNREHPNTNAIVKIDGNPSIRSDGPVPTAWPANPDWATIVATGKGHPDHYVEQVDPYALGCRPAGAVWGQGCLQQDLDFGGTAVIFEGEGGRKLVGANQKSGIFHTFDADTMERVWNKPIGTPAFFQNAAGAAYDGDGIYVTAQQPDLLWALDPAGGIAPRWVHGPAAQTLLHYTAPVSVANGIVYMKDISGTLRAIDANLGVPLFALKPSGSSASGSTSAGIAIARNAIYMPVAGTLYRITL